MTHDIETSWYISAARYCVLCLDSIKSQELLRRNEVFTIGSTKLTSLEEKNFIDTVLGALDCTYLCQQEEFYNEYNKDLLCKYGDRVKFFNGNAVDVVAMADIFIPFKYNSTIDRLLQRMKKSFLGNPFAIGMSNIEAKKYFFEKQDLIAFFLRHKGLEYNIVCDDDIDMIMVGDILSCDELGRYTNSAAKGVEQYLLYIELAVSNEYFLNRIREINYISSLFSIETANGGASNTFIETLGRL